jgi:hypothetical protein
LFECHRERGRRKAEGRRQKADGRRQKAGGRRQEADGRRRKAEGRRQKAEGGLAAYDVLERRSDADSMEGEAFNKLAGRG